MDDKVAEKLKDLARKIHRYQWKYEEVHDGRAVFAYVYCKMTQDTANYLLRHDAAIHDPDWVVKLAEAFAERYFAAMNAIDSWLECKTNNQPALVAKEHEKIPRPWQDVYDAIRPGQSSVLEDLVFAIMAHISHDLPCALEDIHCNCDEHVEDFQVMNDVLEQQIGIIERDVTRRYSRFLAFLDRITGNYGYFFY